jgi:predicted acyl esterase
MIGISAYGAAQLQAAALQPPHLKAIFPFDPGPAYREFRDRNPGGVLHMFPLTIDSGSVSHGAQGRPSDLPSEDEQRWIEAMSNPDLPQRLVNAHKVKGEMFHLLSKKGSLWCVHLSIGDF